MKSASIAVFTAMLSLGLVACVESEDGDKGKVTLRYRGREITHQDIGMRMLTPRELFRTAIVRNASAIVVAHSHPSGDPTPSHADIRATRDLVQAGRIVRIEVLDHLVIGQPSPDQPQAWASLRELGHIH